MKTRKDELIKELKRFISNDGAWLTREQQDIIIRRIDELDFEINQAYEKNQKGLV